MNIKKDSAYYITYISNIWMSLEDIFPLRGLLTLYFQYFFAILQIYYWHWYNVGTLTILLSALAKVCQHLKNF